MAGLVAFLALIAHVTIHSTLEMAQPHRGAPCSLCQASRTVVPTPVYIHRPAMWHRQAIFLVRNPVWRANLLLGYSLFHRPPPAAPAA